MSEQASTITASPNRHTRAIFVSLALVVLLLIVIPCALVAWVAPEWSIVRERRDFAAAIVSVGGIVTAEPSGGHAGSDFPSPIRRFLGDQAIGKIRIPFEESFLWEQLLDGAKQRFPETTDIAIALPNPADSKMKDMLGGATGLKAVAHPNRTTASRLVTGDIRSDETRLLDKYRAAAEPKELPPNLAARISQMLVSPMTYRWGITRACLPSPGVRLSFVRGDERVDVLLCFECDILLVFRNDKYIGQGIFDGASNELVEAMKELFPADPVIQACHSDRKSKYEFRP